MLLMMPQRTTIAIRAIGRFPPETRPFFALEFEEISTFHRARITVENFGIRYLRLKFLVDRIGNGRVHGKSGHKKNDIIRFQEVLPIPHVSLVDFFMLISTLFA